MRSFIRRVCIVLFLGGLFFIILNSGIIWFNMPSRTKYPVIGVDVSAHQGDIDWRILSKDLSFAFIKATEGSSWSDKKFQYNWEKSLENLSVIGAYHFFSFDSSGETQAKNFIANVPNQSSIKNIQQDSNITKGSTLQKCILPPGVDIEFYGNKSSNPPSPESIYKELDVLLTTLEKFYGKKPIIYTTPSFYKRYLHGRYTQYPLWIRSIFFPPDSIFAKIFDVYFSTSQWSFWQYNPKGVLQGYTKGEKFIDLNAYNGTWEDFQKKFCNLKK
ncbi:lysozyme [Helicobacter didelphidarum]|uniref:Lysozyme n=1 Tax=Helicobacter didelphidarum TaxID=2040648 RepID=A0A3D8IJ58_9HELI|nr:GH25 family lysozyme [Helicobacter didelphidarum]RDU65259.1 lysozyme [Helicobacter didelphidarum]